MVLEKTISLNMLEMYVKKMSTAREGNYLWIKCASVMSLSVLVVNLVELQR